MIEVQAAYTLALISAVAFGSADFLGGLSARRVGLLLTSLTAQLAGCAVLLAGTIVSPGDPTMSDILWSAAAGAADCAGLLLLFRALSIGQMAGVAPVSGVMSSMLPVVVGYLFLGERPAMIQWLGITLGIAAIVAIGWKQPTEHVPNSQRVLPLVLAAAAGSGFAVYYILFSHISSTSGVTPVLTARIASTLIVLGWIVQQRDQIPKWGSARLGLAIGAGALASGGNLLFVLAVRQGELGATSVLASLYPALTAIFAIVLLRERPRAWQWMGIGAAVAAVGMIAST